MIFCSIAIRSISIVRCPHRVSRTRPSSCSIAWSFSNISSAEPCARTTNAAFTKSGPDPLGNAGVWKKRLSDVTDPTDTAIRERAVLRTSLELELFNLWLLPMATMQSWQYILSSFAYIMGITYTCSLVTFTSICDIFLRSPPLLTEIRADYI